MKTLRDVTSFGGIDADVDDLLDACFQDHEAYLDAIAHKKTLLLGRKGSGKTAIFRRIIRTRQHDFFAFGHTFSDYPWQHHALQEMLGVPEELRYVQSWQYLILLTAAKLLLNQDQSQPWHDDMVDELDRLEKYVVDSYGSRDPDVTQLFTPNKRLKIKPHLKIAKGFADAGLDFEQLPVADLPRIIQEVNANISRAVINCLNPNQDYFICFDELDRGFDPKSPSYSHMLTGLILAAKLLNDQAKVAKKRFSVVIFLRDDIYHLLRFEDKNKITENFASRIEWDSSRTKWTLQQLMERRFSTVVGDDNPISWAEVFNEDQEMAGRQTKYQHMLDRTFRRPRDIIKFSNEVLATYHKRSVYTSTTFSNEDITGARPIYSDYLLKELDDEMHKHIPNYESYLELLRVIGTAAFNAKEFQDACIRRADLMTTDARPIDLLRQLFEFSVIAYQRTGGLGGGSGYVWAYLDLRARFDETAINFRVHPGLIEALGIKKFGSASV